MTQELIKKFTEVCIEILNITTKMVEGPNKTSDKYTRVMEGICRRNYFKLHSIMILASDEFTGDAILDLSRSLLEDMICVEFMKLHGTADMAIKFMDYSLVEQKLDTDFLLANEGKVSAEEAKQTQDDFDSVKDRYMRKPGEISRSWAMCDIEQMIKELLKGNVMSESEKNMILQAYVMGNRKNHLSPIDTLTYISGEFREMAKDTSKETGLLFSLVSYIKIADEFAIHLQNTEVSEKLKNTLIDLNKSDFNSLRNK